LPGLLSFSVFFCFFFLTLVRWLGRVGVVRNELGEVIGALSLQLPGDIAAYESLMYRSCSDAYDVLNPLDTSNISVISMQQSGDTNIHQDAEDDSPAIPPEFFSLGIFGALRFRYKHTIICDHVCPPGEAYVDFLAISKAARRNGAGSRLMQWAEQSAEKLGCGRIALSVWGLDKEAQLFYERLGKRLDIEIV
jgi:ribosomal protein S18 acetylase RimI-like enzyme